jgi:flagellar hook-associated protein 2
MASSTSSISGLASGLDTASIIDQLMQLEAVPQSQLKSKQSEEKAVLSALQSINSDFASLLTKAKTLADPATWQTLKAASTSSDVTATSASGAVAGSFTVTVGQLAAAAQTSYDADHALTDTVVTGPVTLTAADGSAHTISTGTGTLTDLVAGINNAKAGVAATTVRTGTNTYRLLLTADSTGQAASAIGLTGVNVGTATSTTGQDAQLTVGGIQATSTTNTFTDLVPGVTVTLAPTATAGTTSTITVAQDTSSVKDAVKALVDQVNSLLGSIDAKSATATSTGTTGTSTSGGPLAGDTTVRSARDALAETVFGSGTASMAAYGVQLDRYGKLVFDGDAFDKAYAADPGGVMRQFTSAVTSTDPTLAHPDGWAARVAAVASSASDTYTGSISLAITGTNSTIDDLTKSIAGWDDRLALRKESLQRQYTALETALSSMQSQGSWLSSQLASLPTSSS